jgi:hypothetical protein
MMEICVRPTNAIVPEPIAQVLKIGDGERGIERPEPIHDPGWVACCQLATVALGPLGREGLAGGRFRAGPGSNRYLSW